MRRLLAHGSHHDPPVVAEALDPDRAGAPFLGRRPLDRVVAIGCIDHRERMPLSLGLAPPAGVVMNDGIASLDPSLVVVPRPPILVIGRPVNDRGNRQLRLRRQVDRGGELDAITHRNADLERPRSRRVLAHECASSASRLRSPVSSIPNGGRAN